MKQLEQKILQFLDRPTADGFEPLALEVYRFQRAQNEVFSKYCDYLGISPDLASWKDIPGVPQQAFKHSKLRCYPEELDQVEFRTSGTTGEGYGRHYFPSLPLYEAGVKMTWNHFRLPQNRFLLLMQHPEEAPHSSLSRMGGILNGYRREDFFVTPKGVLEIARFRSVAANQKGPVTVFGTALAFLNLFESSLPVQLPPESVVVETGGFKGSGREIAKDDLYRRFKKHFDMEADSIWNEYGMTELSSQFYSQGLDRPHLGPPWMRFLIINPDTNTEAAAGETGLLKIIDLTNLWSVMAVQTQDLARASPSGGFFLLGRDPTALPRGCSRAMDNLHRLQISEDR